MKNKIFLTGLIIIIILMITGIIFLKPAFKYVSGYLSKSEEVNANVLIVEGWLPDYAFEMATEEFKKNKYDYIVTTGIQTYSDYYGVYSNGYLIFYTHKKLQDRNYRGVHTFDINAYSELDGENSAHFNILVNDSLIGDYTAKKRSQKFRAMWYGELNKVDSVLVQFDNDGYGDYGDRNLFVRDIVVDDSINIPYQDNSAYAPQFNKKHEILSNTNSNAELARLRLIDLGIDSSRIIATPGGKVRINRTLTSALAFRDWLKKTNKDVKGINIFSMGTHARRTWMTYNKILDEKYHIGIISIPDYVHNHSREIKVLKTLRESIAILYYWFILLPY
jgi:hypothetical protein